MDRGGPYRAGSSMKWACWKMWSMGHTNGSSSRPPPGALHLSNGALQAVLVRNSPHAGGDHAVPGGL